MIQNLPSNSHILNASVEISIMLIGAFTLWFVLSWLLKPRQNFIVLDAIPYDTYQKSQLYPSITKKWNDKQEEKGIIQQNSPELSDKKSSDKIEVPQDKLTLLHWISPKVEKLLQDNQVVTYQDIADTDIEGLEEIFATAWLNAKRYSLTTWPDQARLAAKWHWRELEEYQAILQKKK